MTAIQNKTNNVNKHFLVKKEIILCCFFGGGEGWWFMSLSRIFHLQYGSGKRTNFFFHFADQFYNPRFSAEWFGVNHSE